MGRRGSAYIIATGSMLPVQGNTVHQWRTVINSSIGDQISNSITYSTPSIFGTVATAQYGLNNAVENGDDGTMFAANLFNRSIKNLTISAAYNNMKSSNANKAQLSAANKGGTALTSAPSTTSTVVSAATNIEGTNQYKSTGGQNLEGYAVGLKYKVTPAIEVGTFYAHGRTNNGLSSGAAATNYISSGATGVGVGYQATPTILLGANYVKTTFAAQMVNLQAHYMLSKRTRVYSQLIFNQGATGNNQSGTFAAGSFSPIHCNSSSTTVCADGISSSGGGNSKASNNGYVAGIIHTF
jgi:predicted porin